MAKLTPEEYADKQARNLKNSLQDVRVGISRVTVAPGRAAVQAKEKMRIKLLASLDDGTWERKTAAVSLSEWQEAALTKGVDRIAQGIDAARDKQIQMAGRLLAAVDGAGAKARAMPSNTLQDNIARMTTFVTEMNKSKGKI